MEQEDSSTPKLKSIQHKRPNKLPKRLSSSFKSPMIQTASNSLRNSAESTSVDYLKVAIKDMWSKHQELLKEITSLETEGYKEEELKWYIQKMHEYNEIKDVAQLVMGRIATMEGVTTKDVHDRYGLGEDD